MRLETREVFGIVTTEYSLTRGYFEGVERRDVVTLLPIIARCVRIGTEVHSDDWAAYRQMDHHIHSVSHHQAVVERLHLVDPVTGIHTREVESCRNNLKLGQKKGRGIEREDMQSYLDEKMWRQWRAENPQNAMNNFLAVLAGQYFVNNPVL